MTIAIIRDEKELNRLVSQTIKTGVTYRQLLFQASLSAAVHLLEFGQPGPLNTLFKNLVSNDVGAFKQFVLRLNLYTGLCIDGTDLVMDGNKRVTGLKVIDKLTADQIGKMDKEIRDAYAQQNVVIGYADKSFNVMSVKADPRAKEKRLMAVSLIEKRFAAYSVEQDEDVRNKFKPWFERNNFADVRYLGDGEVFEKIKGIRDAIGLNEKKKVNADRVNLDVSPKMKKLVAQFFEQTESLVEQEDLDRRTVSKDEQIVDAALSARENKVPPAKATSATDSETVRH